MPAPLPLPVETRDGTVLDVDVYAATARQKHNHAVVLCHGIIQNRRAFAVPSFSVPQFLNDAGYDVYAVDMRGRDGAGCRHDFATYVDDDAPAVVDAVKARHAAVSFVGHSMGGLIAVAMPAETQQKLSSIVCLGSPLLPGTQALRDLAVDERLASLARLTAKRGIAFPGRRYSKAFVLLRKALDRGLVPFPLPLWKPGAFKDERDLAHTLVEGFADDGHLVLADLCELGFTNGMKAGRLAYSERLRALSTPLLCVAGSADALAPPDSVHALWSRAGSSDKRYLEVDAGHIDVVLGDLARAAVWPEVVRFLDAHTSSASTITVPESRRA